MATEIDPKATSTAGTEIDARALGAAGDETLPVVTVAERRIGATLLRFVPLALLIVFILYLGQTQASSRKWLSIATDAMLLAAVALGVNVLLGYTGLLSLGHAAFFVIGGYAGAIFGPSMGLPAWAGFLPALVFGALFGAALALMCCHLRGFYLTVVTLAFGALLPAIVVIFDKQLGGGAGRPVEKFLDTSKFPTGGHYLNAGDNPLYVGLFYLSALVLLVTLFLCWNLVRSRWGRAYMAIREAEIAARTSGVNTYWVKVSSFALSAAIVAVAGWVATEVSGAVDPLAQAGSAQTQSFRYVIAIVVGGMGTLVGPIWGAFVFGFGFGISWVQDTFREYNGLLFGVLGLIGVATAPEGFMGNLRKGMRNFQLQRARRGHAIRRLPAPQVPPELTRPNPRSRGSDGEPVLEVTGLTKRFGGLAALADVDVTVRKGTIHALIGPNGSGKTTFINVITGLYDATAGRLQFGGEIINDVSTPGRTRLGIARTFQNLQVWRRMSVVENVMVGLHSRTKIDLFRSLLGTPGARKEERQARERAWGLLEFVGLSDRGHDLAGTLPFADLRRLEIARALASDPELLLVDEPGAGMHPTEIRELVTLIRKVRDAGVTVLLVEHHMDIVMGLSDTVSVLDYGQKIAEGTPDQVRNDQRVIEAYLGAESAA